MVFTSFKIIHLTIRINNNTNKDKLYDILLEKIERFKNIRPQFYVNIDIT